MRCFKQCALWQGKVLAGSRAGAARRGWWDPERVRGCATWIWQSPHMRQWDSVEERVDGEIGGGFGSNYRFAWPPLPPGKGGRVGILGRSEEHTSEFQSLTNLVCR